MALSINPGSGYFQDLNWSLKDPVSLELQRRKFAIPDSLSNDFIDPSGFEQQTFLGASIRSFSVNAGYGDSSSTLSIELINDEYNVSDRTPLGLGNDVYHNGIRDTFAPPQTGSPVFFQFGKKRESVNNAYAKMYDDIYGYDYSFTSSKPQFHFTFGGILQSYVQNRGPGGNPLYSAQIVDPREILANTTLVLNNYAGTTFNNKNMFNLYGFLEYNPTLDLKTKLESFYPVKDVFRKNIFPDGSYNYSGLDLYASNQQLIINESFTAKDYQYNMTDPRGYPAIFPITGTGYSRRCDQGIPYYRIKQALEALLGLNGALPEEYTTAGFGGYINFRGFNYIVDLSGLKKLNDYYFFDFDQINLLDFCLEICDITTSDLFVTLLPIIEHPVCARFYEWNKSQMLANNPQSIIAGIIRIDAIDRSFQPQYGAIKNYIDSLATRGIHVENQDVGFELSNVTTDKFVTGAQEVDMYFFSANSDRDTLEERKRRNGLANNVFEYFLKNQWLLETSLKQQILPYYGLLGGKAVTIPRGFGSYQQILLDSSSLYAMGVGDYYVTTEMELRCALISFERWEEFLGSYNEVYMESLEDDDIVEGVALAQTPNENGVPPLNISNNYAVTVPRCVFPSNDNRFGQDGLPINACNPPYGYPLYYKRATRLGVQKAGLLELQGKFNSVITSGAAVSGADDQNFQDILQTEFEKFKRLPANKLSKSEKEYMTILRDALNGNLDKGRVIALIERQQNNIANMIKHFGRLSRKTKENSLKVYNFIRKIADECLGKKFLVKIPREVNLFYHNEITLKNNDVNLSEYEFGPFGFRPRSINYNPYYETSQEFKNLINQQRKSAESPDGKVRVNSIDSFLTKQDPNPTIFQGALQVNFNPLMDQHEFNYQPTKLGGFVNFDLAQNIYNQKNNLAISQGLVPQDLTNFIENNRVSAYVRFDRSENLDFSSANSDDYSQQSIVGGYFIPDISISLDNTEPDPKNNFPSFPNANSLAKNESEGSRSNPQVAFMKCDVDENFYMSPKTVYRDISVYGSSVEDIGTYSPPSKVWDQQLCKEFPSYTFYTSHYIPTSQPGTIVQRLDFARYEDGSVITEPQELDTDNVYALITLPSRVVSNMDARFRDGPFQLSNAEKLKHYLCMDVVRLPEFTSPGFRGRATNIVGGRGLSFSATTLGNAIEAYGKIMSSVDTVYPNLINVMFPSPIYPDLVALPLMSKERCYGPWVSSQIDRQAAVYSNIPGKVEFIKDENLAPWNFNGYDLMNAAGEMQAIFSNSLLLTSERGGFVIPDAPAGIYLGKFLAENGPLVTNISVDVSDNGIRTTYKMDLYTSSFGKLQKQKQDMISNISRERQKIKDEKNALIRKGLGKNQTSTNLNAIYREMDNRSTLSRQIDSYRALQSSPPPNTIIMRSYPSTGLVNVTNDNQSLSEGIRQSVTNHNVVGSIQNQDDINQNSANYPDRLAASTADYNTALSRIDQSMSPASMEPGHPNMPYFPQIATPEWMQQEVNSPDTPSIWDQQV
jgi:hypothetical protein